MKRIKFFSGTFVFALMMLAMLYGIAAAGAGFETHGIEKDLSVQTARVIQGSQGHMLLNQGLGHDVKKGDLWTLYFSEQTVLDPQTGESLGKFSPPAAIGRITQVHERFSEMEIRCIKDDCQISSGMKAVRFSQIKAWFVDESGAFYYAYKDLRAKLDYLDWQGYLQKPDQEPDSDPYAYGVVFAASEKDLTVWAGGQIRKVCASEMQKQEPKTTDTAAFADLPGMGTPLEVSGFAPVFSLDRKIRHMGVARPVDSGRPYLVFLSDSRIEAMSLDGENSFDYQYRGFGRVVSLSAAGNELIALNIYDPDSGMNSMLLEITGSGFKKKAERIAWVLAFMGAADSSGSRALWGQRFTRTDLLLPVVHNLDIEKDSVRVGNAVEVPFGFSLLGAFSGDVNGNGKAEIGFFNPGGSLVVYEDGRQVWESSESFSGAHGSLLVHDPRSPDMAPAKVEIWGQPSLFSSGSFSLAALGLNQAGLASMIGGGPGRGTVGVFYGHGSNYKLLRLADHFQGPVSDVAVWDDKLLICVCEGGFFSQKGRTHVISVPLAGLVPVQP